MSDSEGGRLLAPATLPVGHRCRSDDLAYTDVGTWYRDHVGRVPVQAAVALERYMRSHDATFAEAFRALTGRGGPIILLDEPTQPRRRKPTARR